MTDTIADYSWLAEDMQAFIAKTIAAYPADAVDFTVAQQRAFYDTMCVEFDRPLPAGLRTEDLEIAGVPCRRYVPSAAKPGVTAIYYHGGGFMVGGLESHNAIVAELSEGAQVSMIAVDYRMMPEHLHPAAYEDARAVAEAVAGPKILCGDSAGGNLAACVCATRPGLAAGQLLIYPGLGGDPALPSYSRHANAPLLTLAETRYYAAMRFPVPPAYGDLSVAPLQASDFSHQPPAAVFSAECDPLASDGAEYAARLREAGVPVEFHEEPGMVHGYLRARHMARGAAESFARMVAALDRLAARAAAEAAAAQG